MNELSLFTGAGGGLLGTKLLGWRHCGYVEIDDYCQQVIAARIKDGYLDRAPIFTDIREFIQSGAADQYRGVADVVTAGFPCQPFSLAGKRQGEDDERNMWPETARAIECVQPDYVLLENNPGIEGYLPVVFGDLRRIGYCVHPPAYVAAASLGAGHRRKRLWVYAHYDLLGCEDGDNDKQEYLQDASRIGSSREQRRHELLHGTCHNDQVRAHDDCSGLTDFERSETVRQFSRQSSAGARNWRARRMAYWETEPDLVRVVHGIPHGVDRLKALGNAQVPIVAKTAWELLSDNPGSLCTTHTKLD